MRHKPGDAVRRGDVVVFRYPKDWPQVYIKRVVGTPGDRIRLVRKALYLNGAPLEEPYVVHRSPYFDNYRDSFPSMSGLESEFFDGVLSAGARDTLAHHLVNSEIIVPERNYSVLGDNRDESVDSRYWGFVPVRDLIGKPVLIYWSIQPPAQSLTEPKPWEGTVRWSRIFRPILACSRPELSTGLSTTGHPAADRSISGVPNARDYLVLPPGWPSGYLHTTARQPLRRVRGIIALAMTRQKLDM